MSLFFSLKESGMFWWLFLFFAIWGDSSLFFCVISWNLFLITMVGVVSYFIFLCSTNFFLVLLLLLTLGGGVLFFSVENSLLFFLFFEFSSFPMFFVILLFGNQVESVQASFYFVCYSLLASVPLLLMILSSGSVVGVFSEGLMSSGGLLFLLLAMFIKLPVYLFHLWLPKAHVESPTGGSVVLASVLLKLGSLGIIQLANHSFLMMLLVSGLGIIVSPILASWQSDTKVLVAFSSIGHMSLLVFGLWLGLSTSFYSSWLMQVAHGFSSAGMFFLVGEASHVVGSRMIYFSSCGDFYSLLFLSMFNAGTPLGLGFFSEMLVFVGMSTLGNLVVFILVLFVLFGVYFNIYLLVSSLETKTWSGVSSLFTLFLLNYLFLW